jgi:hypothetical protein
VRRLGILALALAAATACDTTNYQIDQFPVGVNVTHEMLANAPTNTSAAVIDTGSPMTIVGGGVRQARQSEEIDLFNVATIPKLRARFYDVTTLIEQSAGDVGWGTSRTVDTVLGGDVLSSLAMRINPAQSELFFFPEISGGESTHSDACQAVVPTTLRGGGTIVIDGFETHFDPTRLVLSTCLTPKDPCLYVGGPACASILPDALLVVATGIEPIVLARSTFLRANPGVDVDGLPTQNLYIPGADPSTPTVTHVATLPSLAIAGQETVTSGNTSLTRGACNELYASRMMEKNPNGCATHDARCPFPGSDKTGATGATVELYPTAGLEVAIVDDTDPLLQSLRAELQPDVAQVDGLIGMQALRQLLTDVDYPNSRMIFCCEKITDGVATCDTTATDCVVRPRIGGSSSGDAKNRRDELLKELCLDENR